MVSTREACPATTATAIVASVHESASPTSATETLKRLRSRSLSDRTTWRLSLRERDPSILRRRVKTPTEGNLEVQLLGDFFGLKELDHVALFDVIEVFDRDAALLTGANLGNIVLEALQRSETAGVYDDVVA